MDNRFEQNRQPEEKWEEKEMVTASEASERIDEIFLRNIEKNVEKKLDDDSSANLLTGLKGNIIDPLYENSWIKGESDIGRFEKEAELKGFLMNSLEKHYRTFLIPGHLHYDRQSGETRVAEPKGLGYETQKMLLEKSGLLEKSHIKFFDGGDENSISKEDLKNGLKIHVTDAERNAYVAEQKEKGRQIEKPQGGSTALLFEILSKAGFFDELEEIEKSKIMGMVVFADVIEKNRWLEPTAKDFFDQEKINLFKINRLLSHEQISGVIGDFLKEVKFNWDDFSATRERIKSIVIAEAQKPIPRELVKKYDMEKKIAEQELNIRKSRQYLELGKNRATANLDGKNHEIIYLKNPSSKWKDGIPDRLPGQLPALAAKPPLNENGRPRWEPKSAYFEVSDASLLAYVKRENINHLLKNLETYAKSKNLNLQTALIGGWVKIFIPFRNKLPSDFTARLENNWLKLNAGRKEVKESKRKTKTVRRAAFKQRKAANF